MTNFLLLYIAILITFDIILGKFIIFNFLIPLLAIVAALLISLIYIALRKSSTQKQSYSNRRRNFGYQTKETEEERKKRVNEEVDRIIHKK